MLKTTRGCAALIGAFCSPLATHAQEPTPPAAPVQRIEITGSAIKRIASEGALPVQSFTQADIRRSGVTSVTDFIQQLPVMQGFTVLATSVGGGGGGTTTASIHDLGASYTLVLLNGRRVAPATTGSTIDLNSIPLSAIERIDVLTDGAGSLYGADAIAGVVNFILKKGAAPWQFTLRASQPQQRGGRARNVSLSKGFGDLDSDGYSLFATVGLDREQQLKASDRDFARTGIIPFTDAQGRALTFFNGSTRAVPPNVDVRYLNPTADNANNISTTSFSPYLMSTGNCPPAHVKQGRQCSFDFTSSIEILPELERKSLFVSGEARLNGSGLNLFADLAYTDVRTLTRIAPYPAEFSIPLDDALYTQYVAPHLTQAQRDNIRSINVKYRLYELGNRSNTFDTTATHAVAGVRGTLGGFEIDSAVTASTQKQLNLYDSGYPLAEAFNRALVTQRSVDPFPYALGSLPPAMLAALKATQFTGTYNTGRIDMWGADARLSRELFALGGGSAQVAFGFDARQNGARGTANPAVANAEILFDDPQTDLDLRRWSAGTYAELRLPLSKALEINLGARADAVGPVIDHLAKVDRPDQQRQYGQTQKAGTAKLSLRYQHAPSVVMRASVGSGFHVASMSQIAQPLLDFGVTGSAYDCPFTPSFDPLGFIAAGYVCDNGSQLEAFNGGNAALKPEKSRQWSLGMVFEPSRGMSIGLDLWSVSVKNAISNVSEAQILGDPSKYLALFGTKFKASNNLTYVAIKLLPINIGRLETQGLDWDFKLQAATPAGQLTGRVSGTYLIKSRYTQPGTDNEWETSLGRYGSNGAVSFRNIISAQAQLDSGAFTNALTLNYRDGYRDMLQPAANCLVRSTEGCETAQLDVRSHTTLDWQGRWQATPMLGLVAGVQNLENKHPPLSLRTGGSHQLGYDPRYASPLGRTFYVQGSVTY
jgi:iron complex outermembrane recepter protein